MAPTKKSKYTSEDMACAIDAVKNRKYNVSQAAKRFGIPRQTLDDKISKRYKSNTAGRKTALTEEE